VVVLRARCAVRLPAGNTLEGFGIVTLASLLPVFAVELMSTIIGATCVRLAGCGASDEGAAGLAALSACEPARACRMHLPLAAPAAV
jgi:hypothetical protein